MSLLLLAKKYKYQGIDSYIVSYTANWFHELQRGAIKAIKREGFLGSTLTYRDVHTLIVHVLLYKFTLWNEHQHTALYLQINYFLSISPARVLARISKMSV